MIKHRFVFYVKYNGLLYNGWQRQESLVSIQSKIENAFNSLFCEKISVYASGRTDKGVHAIGQVIHSDLPFIIEHKTLLNGLNYYLPKDIRITYCKEVDLFFDSRYSAIYREYKYVVYNSSVKSIFFDNLVYWFRYEVNIDKILSSLIYLRGYHNFSSFSSFSSNVIFFFKKIYCIKLDKFKNFLVFTIVADSFLYKMVRKLIGVLLFLSSTDIDIEWIKYCLEKKDNSFLKFVAPSCGLYLANVFYPVKYNLPRTSFVFSDSFL